jgi:plastocyanin
MEQKQLDEIDESYFGEEFIDDEEIKIEDVKSKKKTLKKAAKKVTKTSKKGSDVVISEVTPDDVKIEIIEEEPLKKGESGKDLKKEPATPDVDPWADDMKEHESGMGDAGTWKALTGILIVLLIFSVFTNGFQFSDAPESNDGLTLSQAEAQVLAYVNSNLLRPPFSADVETSEDLGSVFRVHLNVAGQSIESYLTKDGQYFFPQGFDVDAVQEPVVTPPVEEPVVTPPVEEPVVEEPVVAPPVAPPVEESVVNAQEISVSSRKWVFTPDVLRVKVGQPVTLTVLPDNTQASFVLPTYTFGIKGQGISEEITERTTVQFTPQTTGEFLFSCTSCEEWRGMSGTLIVE